MMSPETSLSVFAIGFAVVTFLVMRFGFFGARAPVEEARSSRVIDLNVDTSLLDPRLQAAPSPPPPLLSCIAILPLTDISAKCEELDWQLFDVYNEEYAMGGYRPRKLTPTDEARAKSYERAIQSLKGGTKCLLAFELDTAIQLLEDSVRTADSRQAWSNLTITYLLAGDIDKAFCAVSKLDIPINFRLGQMKRLRNYFYFLLWLGRPDMVLAMCSQLESIRVELKFPA
jgi:hypothetical protein